MNILGVSGFGPFYYSKVFAHTHQVTSLMFLNLLAYSVLLQHASPNMDLKIQRALMSRRFLLPPEQLRGGRLEQGPRSHSSPCPCIHLTCGRVSADAGRGSRDSGDSGDSGDGRDSHPRDGGSALSVL